MVEQEPGVETTSEKLKNAPPLFYGGAGVGPLVVATGLVSVAFLFFGSSLRPAISGSFDALVKYLNSADVQRENKNH